MSLKQFFDTAKKGIYYEAESDDHGARVSTNLSNTICPYCKQEVDPNAEHLCGNRAPQGKKPQRKPKPKPRIRPNQIIK